MQLDSSCYNSQVTWFVRDLYQQSFGIVDNIRALERFDVRETNIFMKIQELQWSYGTVQRAFYSFLQDILDPYLEYMVVGDKDEDNNKTMDYYDTPQMNQERTGSLEELVCFLAKTYQGKLSTEIDANHSWVYSSLEKMKKPEADIDKISNEDFHNYLNDNLANIFDPRFGVGKWMAYPSDFRVDKLLKHLKNKAFFQPINDENPLNGGYDIFSYVMVQPKIMQSSKVKPLLRMTLAKHISDTQDFDKQVFKLVECIFSEYGENILFQLLGIEMADIMKFVQNVNKTYEENFVAGSEKDSSDWIDLADAILKELELLDIDDLFFHLYEVVLKTRNFLLNLDIEKKIYPEYEKIETLMKMSYLHLLSGQWSSMEQAIESSLQTVQTDQFWKEVSNSYSDMVKKYWHLLFLDPSVLDSLKLAAKGWTGLDIENILKLEETEAGDKIFAATRVLRNYRRDNQKSIFQPNFDSVDPRTNILKVVEWLRKTGPDVFKDVESEIFGLFENVSLTPLDWSSLRNVKDKMVDSLDQIGMELEK